MSDARFFLKRALNGTLPTLPLPAPDLQPAMRDQSSIWPALEAVSPEPLLACPLTSSSPSTPRTIQHPTHLPLSHSHHMPPAPSSSTNSRRLRTRVRLQTPPTQYATLSAHNSESDDDASDNSETLLEEMGIFINAEVTALEDIFMPLPDDGNSNDDEVQVLESYVPSPDWVASQPLPAPPIKEVRYLQVCFLRGSHLAGLLTRCADRAR